VDALVWKRARDGFEAGGKGLGPSVTDFRLTVKEGVLHWEAVRLWVLGVPLPRYAFDMRARVCAHGERYRFQIDARLHLLGALISYEGELDVREQ